MMQKQLKIWKEDFLRYYSRTSILMRMILGAALSFAAAYFLIHNVIRPQNSELKKLKQKFQSMEVIDDVDLQVADLKNSQRKTAMQLEGLKKANAALADQLGTLTRGEVGKNILDLRLLIDRNRLRIVSEEYAAPAKPVRRRKNTADKPDTRVKITFPDSMECASYRFQVLGSYQDLRHFFMDVRQARALFFINNIAIRQSGEMLTDKNFNQYRALACSFEVHVPYQKTTGGRK